MVPEKLEEIKTHLDKKDKIDPITVRTLLSWFWQSQRRGWFVSTIRQALAELELETFPDFNDVYIDSQIETRKISKNIK